MEKIKNSPTHTFVVLAYQCSNYLEPCIKSALNQSTPSQVIIATTTPNSFIKTIAKKYKIKLIEGQHSNIGGDFDFALSCADTDLVTIAHQDDIYEPTYTEQIIESYQKHPKSSIIFTDYYELRNNKKIYTNTNLKIKRILLTPIRIKKSLRSKFFKRQILRFGCTICCPAVTFVTKNCPKKIFSSNFHCNVDWHAWEQLSKRKGAFTFVPHTLMGHRISESSTTSKIIDEGIRTQEDYKIFRRFWPKPIAKIITMFYKKSEKSNQL